MTTPAAWPPGKEEAAPPFNGHPGNEVPPIGVSPYRERAHAVISEMADLMRDTQGHLLADGCILGGCLIGFALEAGLSARALRPSLIGVANLSLLCGMLTCWAAAVFLLARASRPVLSALSEIRWVTGAPLDPRAPWLTLPPLGANPEEWTWNRAHLLLGAARLARYRLQFADTWTYIVGGYFLAWTALIVLGR